MAPIPHVFTYANNMIYTYSCLAHCCTGLSWSIPSLSRMAEGNKRRSGRHEEERSASRRRLAPSQDQQESEPSVPSGRPSDGFERINVPGLPLFGTVPPAPGDSHSSASLHDVSFQRIAIPGINDTHMESLEPQLSSSHITSQFKRLPIPSHPAYQLPVPIGPPIVPSILPSAQRSSAGQGVRRRHQAESSDPVNQPQGKANYNKVCYFPGCISSLLRKAIETVTAHPRFSQRPCKFYAVDRLSAPARQAHRSTVLM